MQLAPLSTSLNTQISVNIYTHAETNVAAISAVILAQDSQQRMQPTFWLPHATPFLPATAAAATIRSISSNQVILIHYAYAGNTWETCTSATTTPTMAAQCRSGSRLLTLAGHWHWGQVHVHFALRCRAQACGEHSLPVCECVYLHYIIHTLAHTHTQIYALSHTHDYQNVRHLSFNLI